MEDKVLDTSGLACPLPLVKARQEINGMQPNQVLKVVSTDRGSIKDFQGWSKSAKNVEILKQETENVNGKDIYIHYIKKTS